MSNFSSRSQIVSESICTTSSCLVPLEPTTSVLSSLNYVSSSSQAPLDIPINTFLSCQYFVLPNGLVFVDRKIPQIYEKPYSFSENVEFSSSYFVNLHENVKLYGNYNFLGARVKLQHSKINLENFRKLLPFDFEDIGILQYLEFGFPLGLDSDFKLVPVLKNHSSSYNYFTHIDKFISNELIHKGLTGPFCSAPFEQIMTSPLMRAVKKPESRRAVFDASFGDFSLNINTPEKCYLGEEYEFSLPKIDDFVELLLSLGKGSYMWKRDLSRFFLQLPLDPYDYNKVSFVWRGKLWFFTSYVWGCRHAGMNGQRVSSAVSAIHRSLGRQQRCDHRVAGCKPDCSHISNLSNTAVPFNTLNYSDDFGGAELQLDRSKLSFDTMGTLLEVLNLAESVPKAVGPCQIMLYLGIEFDSVLMQIRVDLGKCSDLRSELEKWIRKTVATKTDIQSILGKLM